MVLRAFPGLPRYRRRAHIASSSSINVHCNPFRTPEAVSAPDPLLYGHDDTARIVAVQPVTDRGSDRGHVHVWIRSEDGLRVSISEVPFYPFLFLSDIRFLAGFDRKRYRFQALKGRLHFNHLVVFGNWNDYWQGLRHVGRKAKESSESTPSYTVPSPAQQYLMQSGRTLFKGMHFDDLHRMQIDIECVSSGDFPNADRPEDRIILVAFSDNRGWRRVLGGPEWTETRLLEETVELIRARDPDVLEGHNVFRFDFPYLMRRCAMHGVPFAIGRDRSEPRTFASSTRFAERSMDFTALDISGRHVIDTFFLVMDYDVVKRDLPGYGLKEVSRYFGFSPADRTYLDGARITEMWKSDPETVIRYAEDDVIETERLARHLSESNFYLTQMLPMEYGQVARIGPASKIESLFVREHLRRRQSLPRSEWGSQSHGGYTDIFFTGITGPVVYADVESLYPSIMLGYNIWPDRDALGLFPELLRRLTTLRLDAKAAMHSEENEELKSALDARQTSYKMVINSFYGYLGFSGALFNDYSEADRVATTGQDILLSIMRLIVDRGGTLIEVDTDGVLFVPPEHVQGEEAERAFLAELNKEMTEGIWIGFDGRYERILSYKKKNYALRDYDGSTKMKGSALVSRSIERFGRRFVRKAVLLLLQEDVNGLHDLYLTTRAHITDHKWEHVDEFSRTETLKDSLDVYQRDVDAGKRTRSAAYELAREHNAVSEHPFRKGDRISWYVGGVGQSGPAFEQARLAVEWDPQDPDENTAYYLKRLDELASRFEPFFSPSDFRSVFSREDLFGFDADSIELRHRTLPVPDSLSPQIPDDDDDEEF